MDPKSIPAFPAIKDSQLNPTHEGMALRDWFAAHAAEGDIAKHLRDVKDVQTVVPNGFAWVRDPLAREKAKYLHADAMLAARAS